MLFEIEEELKLTHPEAAPRLTILLTRCTKVKEWLEEKTKDDPLKPLINEWVLSFINYWHESLTDRLQKQIESKERLREYRQKKTQEDSDALDSFLRGEESDEFTL